MKFKKLLLAALALSPICASAQRLVGLTNATYNHALTAFLNTDSTVYSYTGGNSYYDQALTNAYSYDLSGYYWKSRILKTYDMSGNVLTINTQTCDTPTTWVDVNETDYAYDGSNNVLSATQKTYNKTSGTWNLYVHQGYTYDSHNNMITDTVYYNAGKGYGPQSLTTYSYDASNHLTGYIGYGYYGGTWYTSTKGVYTVNSAGKILTDIESRYNGKKAVWVNSSQDTYTYDGSNNMLSDITQTWDTAAGGSWVNYLQQNWTYSGNDMITFDSASYVSSAWNPIEHDSMSYDGSHNMIARLNSTWRFAVGRYIYTTEWLNTYTAANKIESTTTNSWSTSSSSWYLQPAVDTRALYYYDLLSVHDVYNAGGSIKLYPIPANNFLTVNITWDKAQSALVGIYDLNGRPFAQWQAAAGTTYNTTVSTNSLPSGNYIIKVKGANGVVTERFTVVH
ncbi:MAG: T9SS type A sorting domain-containing protein [Flavipsychrobacter sp.]